jgi:hypothetical protein
MWPFKQPAGPRQVFLAAVALLAGLLAWPVLGTGQDKQSTQSDTHKHADKSADADKHLPAQIRELQAKVAKLEAALQQGHKGTTSGTPDRAGTGGKKMGVGMMGMGGMEGMNPGARMKMMGGMQDGKKAMAGMGMMDADEMMGMMGMGKMKMPSALPGFPGASHIYHIGATGFFLDHPDHITLTTKQQGALNRLKEKALLEKSTSQRKIDEAEQELWTLTSSGQPDAATIGAKVREIEKLRGEQRLAFIRAVGEAARVLSDDQRQALLGTATDKPGTHTGH